MYQDRISFRITAANELVIETFAVNQQGVPKRFEHVYSVPAQLAADWRNGAVTDDELLRNYKLDFATADSSVTANLDGNYLGVVGDRDTVRAYINAL